MIGRIDVSAAEVTASDRRAVLAVLKTGRLAMGPATAAFEKACARAAGVAHGVAVSSGTAGLHALVQAFGIGHGDEVISTPISFVASANCVLFEHARVRFVDIDPITRVEVTGRGPQVRLLTSVDTINSSASLAKEQLEFDTRLTTLQRVARSARAEAGVRATRLRLVGKRDAIAKGGTKATGAVTNPLPAVRPRRVASPPGGRSGTPRRGATNPAASRLAPIHTGNPATGHGQSDPNNAIVAVDPEDSESIIAQVMGVTAKSKNEVTAALRSNNWDPDAATIALIT